MLPHLQSFEHQIAGPEAHLELSLGYCRTVFLDTIQRANCFAGVALNLRPYQ